MTSKRLVAYVDVDDTLVRSIGTKRLPMPNVIAHVRQLFVEGVELYLWSTGGAEYARETAEDLGVAECFRGFLPKPEVVIDDQSIHEWRRLVEVHPASCIGESSESYLDKLDSGALR